MYSVQQHPDKSIDGWGVQKRQVLLPCDEKFQPTTMEGIEDEHAFFSQGAKWSFRLGVQLRQLFIYEKGEKRARRKAVDTNN